MAILQHDPVAGLFSLLDHLLSDGALALTEGDGLDDAFLGLCEGGEGGEGIGSW